MNEFSCPSCQKILKYADDLAGRKAKCPRCGVEAHLPVLPVSSISESHFVTTGAWAGLCPEQIIVLTCNAIIQGTATCHDLSVLRADVQRGTKIDSKFTGIPVVIPLKRIQSLEGMVEDSIVIEVKWKEDVGTKVERLCFKDPALTREFLNAFQAGIGPKWTKSTFRDPQLLRTDIGVGALLIAFILLLSSAAYFFSSESEKFWQDLENERMSLKKLVLGVLLYAIGRILGPIGVLVVCFGLVAWVLRITIRNCRACPMVFRLSPPR